MSEHFAPNDRLISIQHECVASTTYGSITLRILGGSADYTVPEILIDEKFQLHTVTDEKRLKPISGLWNKLKWLMLPVYHVDLVFDGPPQQSTLEKCRELIFKAMELDPELYESSRAMEDWRSVLWSAETFEELYLLIRGESGDYARFQEMRDSRLSI